MSTDYYLYSPSHKKSAMVGASGIGGVKSWPTEYGGKEFIAWAIENNVQDVTLIDEHRLEVAEDAA